MNIIEKIESVFTARTLQECDLMARARLVWTYYNTGLRSKSETLAKLQAIFVDAGVFTDEDFTKLLNCCEPISVNPTLKADVAYLVRKHGLNAVLYAMREHEEIEANAMYQSIEF